MTSWLSRPETREAARAAGFQDAPPATALASLQAVQDYLPMSVIPGVAGSLFESGDLSKLAECQVVMWTRAGQGTLWLLDYEYQTTEHVRGDDGYTRDQTYTYSGTIAALLDPRVTGEVDVRKDWKSGIGGKLLNAFLWVPPFTIVKAFQYAWAPKDLEVGQGDFDSRFIVQSSSAEAAQRAINPALGQCLVTIDFDERLRIRPGVALIRLRSKREPGPAGFAKEMQRLHAIVSAILADPQAQPYR